MLREVFFSRFSFGFSAVNTKLSADWGSSGCLAIYSYPILTASSSPPPSPPSPSLPPSSLSLPQPSLLASVGTREAREEECREEVSSERELSLEYTSLAPSQLRGRLVRVRQQLCT